MDYSDLVLLVAACVSLGFILGYFFRIVAALAYKNSIELEIKKLTVQGEIKAKQILLQAEHKAEEFIQSAKHTLTKKEDELKEKLGTLSQKELALQDKERVLQQDIHYTKTKIEEVQSIKEHILQKESALQKQFADISSYTTEQAKTELLSQIEHREQDILLTRMTTLEKHGSEIYEQKAKDILTQAIQRLATKVNTDILTSIVPIADTEMKGKIIGKEGRNIKVFERETGVELLVDEQPDSITISSFDPIRRYIAKISLEELIKDGRIQPARIEKIVSETKANTQRMIKDIGADAVRSVGIPDLDPRVTELLGRLHFRTSYGQNVLQHSIEVAHLSGMLASEIGAHVRVAKTAGLLHDIGKSLDHEVQGTHVEIGRQVLTRFGIEEAVVKAMQAHHEEHPYETLESRIVQTADAISGSRPGARNDSVEFYIKRLSDLERIATKHKGVEKAYALQAGREIRIFVNPTEISDLEAKNIAKNIARAIEQELKYPGEIKVIVIRETKIVETAL
jgi:ribonuclease Y